MMTGRQTRRPRTPGRIRGTLLAVLLLSAAAAALAQDKPADKPAEKSLLGPWKATAELGYVVSGGNSSTSTFSLGNTFKRKWEKDALTIKTFILRSHSTTTTRTAVGTEEDYTVYAVKTEALVAENYSVNTQYDHRLANKVAAQFALGWDHNKFASLAGRLIFTAGTGYAWVETKRTTFKTDGSITFTVRKYYGQDSTSFAGFRGNFTFEQKILDTSSFASQFILDENLKKTVDWRYDWTNSITASIFKSLALKTSLRIVYANLPANVAVPLYDTLGASTGLTVPVPLKKIDTYFTTSVVINF
jgi:putative salt-induced outer membrane protein YdiY